MFEEDVFHARMDATAFVDTTLRRKTVEVSPAMNEARKRELAEWIQEGAISKVREKQEVPESRLVCMRWVLTVEAI